MIHSKQSYKKTLDELEEIRRYKSRIELGLQPLLAEQKITPESIEEILSEYTQREAVIEKDIADYKLALAGVGP